MPWNFKKQDDAIFLCDFYFYFKFVNLTVELTVTEAQKDQLFSRLQCEIVMNVSYEMFFFCNFTLTPLSYIFVWKVHFLNILMLLFFYFPDFSLDLHVPDFLFKFRFKD